MQNELEQIHLRKTQFIQKYGPHDIVHDVETLLGMIANYQRQEKEYGFMSADKIEMINALRHMCTRNHPHNSNDCYECRRAEDVIGEVKAGKL